MFILGCIRSLQKSGLSKVFIYHNLIYCVDPEFLIPYISVQRKAGILFSLKNVFLKMLFAYFFMRYY